MTIPYVPAGGALESAAQNALIDQSNGYGPLLDAHGNRLDDLEAAPPPAIDDLTDVTITTPVTGQAVIRNASGWVNGLPTPASHTHAQSDITGLSTSLAGKADATHTHAQSDVTGLSTTLAGKADTTTTDALDTRIDALETAPAPALGDLPDVDTAGAVSGQVLKYTGTGWAPGTDNTGGGEGGGATTLDELTDVSTTGATNGQVLGYSAGAWSPVTPTPAAHTHAISDVTGLQAALDAKATTSSVTTLTGRVTTLESAAASLTPTTASDTALYGDVISSHQRSDCQWGESVSNGFMTAVATRSTKTFTASEMRFCVTSAAAGGTGTFDVKVYTGSSLAALTERVFRFGVEHVNATGVKHISIGSLAITEGQYVALCLIVTGWTTSPRLSSTTTGTGAQLLIGEQPYSVYQGGQTFPPPASLNMTSGVWTRAKQLFWFALA